VIIILTFVVLLVVLVITVVPFLERLVRATYRVLKNRLRHLKKEVAIKYQPKDNSLFMFGPENGIRQFCVDLVEHPSFDSVMMGMILLSTIFSFAALGDYSEGMNITFDVINYIFLGIFVLEALAKTIAYCFVLEKEAYLRDAFNCFDFFVVIVAVIIALADFGVSWVKSLRVIRYLRLLRLRYLRVFRLLFRILRENGHTIMADARSPDSERVTKLVFRCDEFMDRDVADAVQYYLRDVDQNNPDAMDRAERVIQTLYLLHLQGQTAEEDQPWVAQMRKVIKREYYIEATGWLTMEATDAQRAAFFDFSERMASEVTGHTIKSKIKAQTTAIAGAVSGNYVKNQQ